MAFDELRRVLVVAPHADDETLGPGGTISRFTAEGRHVTVALMTGLGTASHPFATHEGIAKVRAEFDAAMDVLGVADRIILDLPTTMLDAQPRVTANRAAADVVARARPDLVFLPFEHDLHLDHGILNYAFKVALRPHLTENRRPHAVLAYETPTETHLQAPYLQAGFEPNCWIDVSDHIETKIAALGRYHSQIPPAPGLRSLETLRALATWRGSQIGVTAAEAFVVMRHVA